MLRVLLRFGALVGRHPALEEFMLACHEIAPAAGHHRAEVVSPDPIDDPAAGRPLVETLERLQSDLRAEGDRLDLADQRLNAISYFDAAKHVANARALLAAALQSG
jgi:hypothetical protein